MGFYSEKILPYLMDRAMADPRFQKQRPRALAGVAGETLEIGFGSGLNLAYYPPNLTELTTVEPSAGMNKLAQKRISLSPIKVNSFILNGENLPFDENRFDSVVSTWTLCSIANVEQALREIHRVLKPNGKFYFLEHGLSDEPKVQKWQNRLTPVQKALAGGCHLNRNIEALLQAQNFAFEKLDKYNTEQTPKILSYHYRGIATKV